MCEFLFSIALWVIYTRSILLLVLFWNFWNSSRKNSRRRSRSKVFYKTDVLKKICKLHKGSPVLQPVLKRLQHRCFPMNFAKMLRATLLQSTSVGVLKKVLRLGVHKKIFQWIAVNEFLSNSMEFLHANSKN